MELTGWEIGCLRRLILSKKTNEKSLNETDEILLDKLQDEKSENDCQNSRIF